MARDGSFTVRVLGEVNDLQRKLRTGADSVQGFSTKASNSLKGTVDDTIRGVTSRFGSLGEAAGDSLSTISGRAIDAGGALGVGLAGGAVAAGAALSAMAVQGISSFIDLADKVREVQRVSGATAEESSQLVAVLDDMGIEADKGAAAIFKLSRNIETNEVALRQNGIEVAKAKDGSTDLVGTLLNVAEAYKEVGGGAAGNKIVFEAFGRAGADLIPILQKGRDGIEAMFSEADKHGEVLSQEEVDQAREFELAMDDLGDAVGGLQRSLGKGLVPVIASFAETTANAIDKVNQLAAPLGGIPAVVDAALDAIPGVGALRDVVGWLGGESDKTAEAAEEQAAATADLEDAALDASKALDRQVEAAKDAREALDDLLAKTLELFNSQLGLDGAVDNTEKALQDYTEAAKDAAEAGGKNTEANEELDDATRSAAEAALRQAEAASTAATKQAELAGYTFTAGEKARIQKEELIKVAQTLAPDSPLRKQLDGYIFTLGLIPSDVTTKVNLDISSLGQAGAAAAAAAGFGGLRFSSQGVPVPSVTVNVDARGIQDPQAVGAAVSRHVGWGMARWGGN